MSELLSLHNLLNDLREGRIADEDIPAVLRCFANGFLMEAAEDMEDLISHRLPQVRATAVEVLTILWRIADYRPLCEYVLRYDISPKVRAVAARGLGAILAKSRDKDALRQLLETLRDPDEARIVRYSAYVAALEVAGAVPAGGEKARFNLRRDVDWRLVNDLLKESGEVFQCARCGAPLIRPGDGPAWCLDCTVEVMEMTRATAASDPGRAIARD